MSFLYKVNSEGAEQPRLTAFAAVLLVVFAVLMGIILGMMFGFKAYGRYQARADAQNRVKVSAIEIQNQEQRVKVAQQQAQIRYENAVGIREAQDQIAKTLTPLYVQFEMTEALKAIAETGRNNTVVYIPSGANGIPLVSTLDPQKVSTPDEQ